MSAVHVSAHPLMRYKLAELRDRATMPKRFRELVREMSQLLFYEATADLRTEPTRVATPLTECDAERLGERIGLLPILRAGLGMAQAMLEMVPEARVWHLGLYRDHVTHRPVTYYNKLPPTAEVDLAVVVDPMLATGGSAVAALDLLKAWGVPRVKFIGLIAAPEGVAALRAAHPDAAVFLGALDSHLNADAYIVPGLGDAGDRQFGT